MFCSIDLLSIKYYIWWCVSFQWPLTFYILGTACQDGFVSVAIFKLTLDTLILTLFSLILTEQKNRTKMTGYVRLFKYLWPRLYIKVSACSYLCCSCRFWPVCRYMFPWSCRTSCQRYCSEDLQRPHSPESLRQRGTSHSNTAELAEQLPDCFPKLKNLSEAVTDITWRDWLVWCLRTNLLLTETLHILTTSAPQVELL